ncbi:HAMP domain-containing histidine kinase [Nonomuraea sp. NBC_01738]|uniref:sensor histidine kinase n=1 Tax=Nonomuraea sp. NBC_01738 TaxID=2976003 RepID=UPI002E0EDB44|nr:HAMP domain-containing histidine kinase [Nonomuraea sp. NBC_01738]
MFTTWSVKRRITAVAMGYALLANVTVSLVVTPLVYTLINGYRVEQTAKAARRVAYGVERFAPVGQLKPVAATEEIDLIQVVDNEGKVRQASPKLLGLPPLTTMKPSGEDGRAQSTICRPPTLGDQCLNTVGMRVAVLGEYWMVYAYSPVTPWYIGPLYLVGALGGCVVLAAFTAGVAGMAIGRALEPVTAIRHELAEITATDLGRRMPGTSHEDELNDLAQTINKTLDRLEAAVEQQRRFASDASHDLRSPITAMRAQVEEAMLYPDEADWRETGQALLSSLDRLTAIVTDLLTLARLDAGAPGKQDAVDLGELVGVETSRPRGKRVDTNVRPGVVVTGDRLRLARLLTNLLDNAERHAEAVIEVSVSAEDGMGVLEVLDDGAGIAQDQRETVFNRFTRLDASRNRDAGGTGLGLPIAREIAMAHEGTLTIEDSDTGARFVLRLPLRNG